MIEYLASPEVSSEIMNWLAILLLATMIIVFCVVGYVAIKEILDDDN